MTYPTIDIQKHLKRHGFNPGPIDGEKGPRTDAAIIAFKRSIGYRARPLVGPLTWKALTSYKVGKKPVTKLTASKLPWMVEGYKWMGLNEHRDNAELRKWLASDGHALGDPAVYPWCGDFVETCIRLALPRETFVGDLKKNPYWALNWRLFGQPCPPMVGAVASITRNGGGHVCFLVGEDATRYFCLGGNQSNTVSVVPMDKSRFEPASFRWPLTFPMGEPGLPYMTSSQASNVNEA